MLSHRPKSPIFFAALVAGAVVCGVSVPVPAFSADDALKRPAEKDLGTIERSERPTAKDAEGKPAGDASGGITLLNRMGAPLPDLPAEREYKGPVDIAYGAYQRGLFLTALDAALPRAQLGDPAAQTLIAEMTTRGLGVKGDPKAAAFWYGQAAANGDPAAMFKYALLLMEGRVVARDKPKADEYMKKAAEAGNSSAQFNWGQILVSDNPGQKGLQLALPYYEKSAEQGVADAQYAVAQLYRQLPEIDAEKRKKARYWMERAAKAGFDTAQLDIGLWLVNGIEGERNYEQGFNWLKIAASRGNVVAQNRLSHLYISALGVRPDPIEAAKWYVLSRRAGLKDPELEDFYLGINDEQQKKAIDAANKFRAALAPS